MPGGSYFTLVLLIAVISWVAFNFVQGIRTGNVRGMLEIFGRAEQRSLYWLFMGLHALALFLLGFWVLSLISRFVSAG